MNTTATGDNPRARGAGGDADILDIFDLARARITRAIPVGRAGGQALGSVGGKDPGVSLAGTSFGRPDFTAREKANIVLERDIHILLHELIHLSGVNTYTDYQLAVAVGRMTGTEVPGPTGRGPTSDVFAYGTFWDTELRKHCKNFRVKL